ncbi:hypothetical protein F511_00206 [Dorcoceras hygrometricum]|nr:hypothetical protein F511_00206 [Dorcoceras hygrometricum]
MDGLGIVRILETWWPKYTTPDVFVWEILDGSLKWKIEFNWNDIVAINADLESGILKIMLKRQPALFRETRTESRKRTNWELCHDLTGGQALIWRIHCLVFPFKTLDKHYMQLLNCDDRLLALSQRPFPSQESPYFNTMFSQESCDLNGQGTRFLPGAQDQTTYPTIAGEFAVESPQNSIVSSVINHQHWPHQTMWNQVADFSRGNGNVQGPPSNLVITEQSYDQPYNPQNIPAVGSGTLYANADSSFEKIEELNSDISSAASYNTSCDDEGEGIQSASDTFSRDMNHWDASYRMSIPQEISVEWMTRPPQVATNSQSVCWIHP